MFLNIPGEVLSFITLDFLSIIPAFSSWKRMNHGLLIRRWIHEMMLALIFCIIILEIRNDEQE